ncbi:MAG TPA: 3'-5' exonuclease [Candidatus Omnitrophota bacterium]|nr:3'-5' exonuclease [Candidatus Omnitrophota bacterium]HPN55604.1 3'-5' exonuclease [Candidatus Omnitrophota bacterium]
MMEGLANARFVVLDVETTGLSSRHGDRIIEVAAIKCEGLRVMDRFESLVNPQRPLSYGAYRVNRISAEMLNGAPLAADVLPQVHRFIQGSCLVGHNIKFDLGFLRHEFSSLGLSLGKEVAVLDTCQMARALLPELGGHSLREVAYAVGLDAFQQHRAMADVEMTYEVFRALLQVAQRHDIYSMPLLMRMFGPRPVGEG